MLENVFIKFYEITHCGYYDHEHGAHCFGTCEDTLSNLSRWVKPKILVDTCTFDFKNSNGKCRALCLDITGPNSNQDFIIAMWNETHSSNGKIASIDPLCKIGEAKASLADFPKNNIPGFATYFWFIPSENVMATLSFKSRPNGIKQLRQYLHGFLRTLNSHVITQNDLFSGIEVEGYTNDKYGSAQLLNPRFESTPMKKDGEIEYVIKNQNLIKSIHRTSEFSSYEQSSKSYLLRKLIGLKIISDDIFTNDLKTKFKMNYNPTLNELHDIIAYWRKNYSEAWDDVGFTFMDTQSIYWLGNSLVATTIKLNIKRKDDEIINIRSLFKEISNNREQLVSFIQ